MASGNYANNTNICACFDQVSADSGIGTSPPTEEQKILPRKLKLVKLKQLLRGKSPPKPNKKGIQRSESLSTGKERGSDHSSSKCSMLHRLV